MQYSQAVIATLVSALPLINAHALMQTPAGAYFPDSAQKLSPLLADGSDFPCKIVGSTTAFPKPAGIAVLKPGTQSQLVIKGSAVHGGGSCQVSITYDNPPTANSTFKVIQSFEGGCPVDTAGNLTPNPENLNAPLGVNVPEIKGGDAVFVWTWFNKIGNREMYMNCAPVTIQSDVTTDTAYDALPDMFVANIKTEKTACTTHETFDIQFPNPGQKLVASKDGNFQMACGTAPRSGAPPSDNSGNSGNSGSAPAASSAAPVASVTSTPSSGNNAAAPTGAVNKQPGTPTTLATQVSTTPVATAAPVATKAPAAKAPAAAPAVLKGQCDPSKGSIICESDPSMYSQCFNDGSKYGPFAVPPGTSCTSEGGFFTIKKATRARRHFRQHIARSI